MLTNEQIRQFHEDGAVVVPGVLDAQPCARMKAVLATLVEGARTVGAQNDIYDLEPGHSADLGSG